MSADAAFITALERIDIPKGLITVSREMELLRTLREAPAAAALIDSVAVGNIAQLTQRLKMQFPRLSVIVAGTTAEDEIALADQMARGTVLRFVLKNSPASRLRSVINEALKSKAGGSASTGGGKGKLWAIIGGVVVVAGLGGAYSLRSMFLSPAKPSTAAAGGLQIPADTQIDDQLARADAAIAAGGMENAYDMYKKAREISPGDSRVKDLQSRVVKQMVIAATKLLLDRNLERAQALAKMAMDIDPDYPPALQLAGQISAAQNGTRSSAAPAAAAPALQAATGTAPAARPRSDDPLRHAQELMHQGRLLEPAQDNARLALQRAREANPVDPRLRPAQREMADLLLADARHSVAAGHPEDIERFISPLQESGARPEEISALKLEAQRAAGLDRSTALFNERLQQGKILDPTGDSAKYYFSQLMKVDPNSPATQIARMALGARLLAEAQSAVRQKDAAGAKRWIGEARDSGVDPTSIANVEADLLAAQTSASASKSTPPAPVLAAPLQKVRDAPAEYPAAAESRRLKGSVSVRFTVRADGTTGDFAVLSATPTGVFEQAAIDAVRKWRYRPPVTKEGAPTDVRAEITMNFAP